MRSRLVLLVLTMAVLGTVAWWLMGIRAQLGGITPTFSGQSTRLQQTVAVFRSHIAWCWHLSRPKPPWPPQSMVCNNAAPAR